MGNKKAISEIEKLKFNFKYDFDNNVMNKFMFCIEQDGYSIKDIISKLNKDETLIFMINNGKTWNGKMGNKTKFLYDKKYDNSIYWEHDRGDCVRIDSDQGSIRKWSKVLDEKFHIKKG